MTAVQDPKILGQFPPSFALRRFWFAEQLAPGDPGNNIAVRWHIAGRFSAGLLENALRAIVARHEILRTRLVDQGGDLCQQVLAQTPFKLDVVDIRQLPATDHEPRIQAIAQDLGARPFDLTQPPLLRVALVQTHHDQAEILITAHHTVFDGYSIRVLGRELGTIAAAIEEGGSPDLPDLPLQYGDFALWQGELLDTGALQPAQDYWTDQLRGMAYFELPPDHPRQADPHRSAGAVRRDLPEGFDAALQRLASAQDASAFMIAATVTAAALARATGRSDVSFATPAACRDDPDLEQLIGVFINTLVLRLDLAPGDSFAQNLRHTRAVVQGALEHADFPFDLLVRALNPARDPLRRPLTAITFNMQKIFMEEADYGPFTLTSAPSHAPGIQGDLSINLIGRRGNWALVVDYDRALYDPAQIEALADSILECFAQALAQPDQPLLPAPDAVAPPAPDADRARLTQIWADLLNLPPDRITGDFYQAGGHSVLALRMLARVEQAFGHRPAIAAFLRDPTLDGLLAELTRARIPAPARTLWDLFELRTGAPHAPVIVAVNQPLLYQSLTRGIEPDCTIACLTVPDRATMHAQAGQGLTAVIEAAQSLISARYAGRPLILIGLCVDGVVALATALALSANGADVRDLVLIDSWAPDAGSATPARTRWMRRQRRGLRRVWHNLRQKLRGQIAWRDLALTSRLPAALLRRLNLAPPVTDAERLIDDLVTHFLTLTRDHSFPPYRGSTIVIRTDENLPDVLRDLYGWGDRLPADTAVFHIPGWHGDAVLRQGFQRLSRILGDRIRRIPRA